MWPACDREPRGCPSTILASSGVRGPAETPTIPPAHVLPPENVAAIALKHDNELL